MKSRKTKKADLEGKRTLFFLLGLGITLVAVIFIIQLKKEVKTPELPEPKIKITNGIEIPNTRTAVKDKPDKEAGKSKPETPPDPNKISEVPDDTKLILASLGGDNEEPDENPVDIDMPSEEGQVMEWIEVEHIAHPADCNESMNRKDESICLNNWIAQYLSSHIKYPKMATINKLEDKVYVSFVIDHNGEVADVQILRGDYKVLNDEAKRVIEDMPKFVPASQQGHNVGMRMRIPVTFKLTN